MDRSHSWYRRPLRPYRSSTPKEVANLVAFSCRFIFIIVALILLLLYRHLFLVPVDGTISSILIQPDVTNQKDCRLLGHAENKCQYVRKYCRPEETGLVPYLELQYCLFENAKPVGIALLIGWLAILFSTIGVAASEFFCLNLNTISSMLGLSESFAGVTFLAFGNGSPDMFSTFAAMNANHSSLAIGELYGAAGFITTVVIGSMALAKPFYVTDKSFIRDVGFFLVAVGLSLWFLSDGKLEAWESAAMVGLYVIYVLTVVFWHWGKSRYFHGPPSEEEGSTSRWLDQISLIQDVDRLAPGSQYTDTQSELRFPTSLYYRDDPSNQDVNSNRQTETEALENHMATIINQNMHLVHPRTADRRSSITSSARPSLWGVLEFRSLLARVEKDGNRRAGHIFLDDCPYLPRYPRRPSNLSHSRRPESASMLPGQVNSAFSPYSTQRRRAVSTNGALHHNGSFPQPPDLGVEGNNLADTGLRIRSGFQEPFSGFRSNFLQLPGDGGPHGAPESMGVDHSLLSPLELLPPDNDWNPTLPSPHRDIVSSEIGSGDLSAGVNPLLESLLSPANIHPFESASAMEPIDQDPLPVRSRNGSLALRSNQISPYSHLMSTIVPTLFPTLTNWNEKSGLDRLLGLIAAPTFFLLILTLPVVDGDRDEYDNPSRTPSRLHCSVETSEMVAEPELVTPDQEGGAVSNLPQFSIDGTEPLADHEFQLNLSIGENSVANPASLVADRLSIQTTGYSFSANELTPLPLMPVLDSQSDTTVLTPPLIGQHYGPSVGGVNRDHIPCLPPWNRWLLLIQTFTVPLFFLGCVLYNSESVSAANLGWYWVIVIMFCLGAYVLTLTTTGPDKLPSWHNYLSFAGFVLGIAWIGTIANEVVLVLKALGVILDLSDAILGLTVFAIGNSLGDLVANITFARLGYPIMALSACIGSPMLNILLGIGITGLYMTSRDSSTSGIQIFRLEPYEIGLLPPSLILSATSLMVTLLGLLIIVPARGWKMDRKAGMALLALWSVSTTANVALELYNTRQDT